MFKMWKTAAVAAFLATPMWAQDLEIQNTISNQIAAFQADDFSQAFTYASPNIQRIFGNAQNFERMVTTGYPMVVSPRDVQYLEQAEIAGDTWQKVLIVDQQGETHVLGYRMMSTENGWKINGVQLLPKPGVGA